MPRAFRSITVALCAALALHGLIFWAILWRQARIYEAQLAEQSALRPAPPHSFTPDRAALVNPYGEAGGKGEAANSAPGELAQLAPSASDREQAGLSRDPVGPKLDLSKLTALAESSRDGRRVGALLPEGDESSPPIGPPAQAGAATPRLRNRQRSSGGLAATPALPAPVIGPSVAAEVPAPAPEPVAVARPSLLAMAAPRATGGTMPAFPGSKAAPAGGEPYAVSDQDSDPFRNNAFAVFRAGKMDARPGRKARLTRPLLSFKAIADIVGSYPSPTVVFALKTDPNGKVVNVIWPALRSSGSNEVDMAVYEAAWHWWFEPRRDKEGKPLADSFPYGIVFVR